MRGGCPPCAHGHLGESAEGLTHQKHVAAVPLQCLGRGVDDEFRDILALPRNCRPRAENLRLHQVISKI